MYNYYRKNKRIKFIYLTDFYDVNNRKELNFLKTKVKNNLKKIDKPLKNKSTKREAIINKKSINKVLFPTPYFNPFSQDYILNINALIKIKELFANAIYIDTFKAMKNHNNSKKYHHFVAPLIINNNYYRVLITTYEIQESSILHIKALRVEKIDEFKNKTIKIEDLVKNISLYNYENESFDYYDLQKMENNQVIKEPEIIYYGI